MDPERGSASQKNVSGNREIRQPGRSARMKMGHLSVKPPPGLLAFCQFAKVGGDILVCQRSGLVPVSDEDPHLVTAIEDVIPD